MKSLHLPLGPRTSYKFIPVLNNWWQINILFRDRKSLIRKKIVINYYPPSDGGFTCRRNFRSSDFSGDELIRVMIVSKFYNNLRIIIISIRKTP